MNNSPPSSDVRFPRGHLPRTEETVLRRTECNFELEVYVSQFLYLAMLMKSDSQNSALSSSIRVHRSSKNEPSLFHWKLLQVKKALKDGLNVLFCFVLTSFHFVLLSKIRKVLLSNSPQVLLANILNSPITNHITFYFTCL